MSCAYEKRYRILTVLPDVYYYIENVFDSYYDAEQEAMALMALGYNLIIIKVMTKVWSDDEV